MKAKLLTLFVFLFIIFDAKAVSFNEAKREGLICREYIRNYMLRHLSLSLDKIGELEFPRDLEKRKYIIDQFDGRKISLKLAIEYTKEIRGKKNVQYLDETNTCPAQEEFQFFKALIVSLDEHDWGRSLAQKAKTLFLNHIKRRLSAESLPLENTFLYVQLLLEYVDRFESRLSLEVNREVADLMLIKTKMAKKPDLAKELVYSKYFANKITTILNRPDFKID